MELDAVTNSVLNAIDTNGFRQEGHTISDTTDRLFATATASILK